MLPDTASGQIAIETGIRGSNMCIVTACSTGTHNIGEAAEGIRRGDFIGAMAGSTENPLHELAYIGFMNMRGMGTPRDGEPLATVSRPFDLTRNGFVLGEGAGAMMLEDLELRQGARREGLRRGRRLRLRGRRLGPHPADREGRRHAPGHVQALERHNVPADEVDLINPHGTSTPLGDLREAQAIWTTWGEHTPKIAISAHEVADRPPDGRGRRDRRRRDRAERLQPVRSRHRRTTATPIPEINLDVVSGEARPMEIRYAISNNIGLGGHNGAVIFKRYDGD